MASHGPIHVIAGLFEREAKRAPNSGETAPVAWWEAEDEDVAPHLRGTHRVASTIRTAGPSQAPIRSGNLGFARRQAGPSAQLNT